MIITCEAAALHNLRSITWTRGRLREAEQLFSAALARYRDLNLRHPLAETLNSRGLTREARGQWNEASNTFHEALALFQFDDDEYGQAQVLANLGSVLILLGVLCDTTASLRTA